jgi:hypothetical protein
VKLLTGKHLKVKRTKFLNQCKAPTGTLLGKM